MKKVLIVSPHFPPINAPDMQRVRLALPFLRARGWEPTVLAVAADSVEGGVRDPMLASTFPADIRVVRVKGISPRLTRWAGFGSLWWRCGRALARAGEELLRTEQFDLVFFSTTQFGAFQLGPRWRQRFGVPFVVDYQDPWVNDYYERTGTTPPGGHLKFALAQRAARRAEPAVLRAAAGIVSVSEAYAQTLARNYRWFDAQRVRTLPFGAAETDFGALGNYRPALPLIDFGDGRIHHVYVGRCGPDMELALSILFGAFRRFRETHPTEAAKIQFDFIGTDYAPPPRGREWARPVAIKAGVGDAVREHRYRVPYFDALYYLHNAQALVAVGSDDPTYSASKIYPYVLARRPLLLIFHHLSPVMRFAERSSAGRRFDFEGPGELAARIEEVHERWFVAGGYREYAPFDESAFAPYSAEAMTAQLAEVFEAASAQGAAH